MSRLVTVTVRSLFLSFGIAGLAAAQDPPPLESPSLEPSRAGAAPAATSDGGPRPGDAKPAAPAAAKPVRPAPPRPEFRPMLAIPGVTAPAGRPSAASRPTINAPVPSGNPPFSPPLEALPLPSELPTTRSAPGTSGFPLADLPSSTVPDALPRRADPLSTPRPAGSSGAVRPGSPTTQPLGDTIPLTIEPLDEWPSSERGSPGRPLAPRSMDGRSSGGPASRTIEPDDAPIAPRPAPRRGVGVLGRLFGPQPSPLPPAREESRPDSKPRRDADSERSPDPDTAARRRIERQIRATLGDKVRSVDVAVTGRNVTIVAQPSRFWLRRSVRRSLETLPALQGYRARIEVGE